MKTIRAALLAASLAIWLAPPLAAGSFSDLVMAPGTLSDMPEAGLAYSLTRNLPPRPEPVPGQEATPLPQPIAEGSLTARLAPGAGGTELVLRRLEDGTAQPEITVPAGGPNPVLLFFLENTVRVIAAETGGSPFYIRNRMREALGGAALAAGTGPQTLTLHPFAEDANRERLGAFGDLALSITFDPAEPGRLIELKADTGGGAGGYTEILRLIPEKTP